MTETNEYRNKINSISENIKREPEMRKMRDDISEGIKTTGNRQADVETQFQQMLDDTTGKDVISAPEITAARNGKPNLKARLDDEHQQVTAQLAQTIATKVDKNGAGQITWGMAAQDLREQITGGNTAVVGVDSVIEDNVVDGAITPQKITPNKTVTVTEFMDFEIGGMNSDNGTNQNKDNRMRTIMPTLLNKGDRIYFNSNGLYDSIILIYSSEDISDFVYSPKDKSFKGGVYTAKENEYVRILIHYLDDRTLNSVDDLDVNQAIYVIKSLQLETENVTGVNLSPSQVRTRDLISPTDVFKDFVIGGLSTDAGTSNTRNNRLRNDTPLLFRKGTSFSTEGDSNVSFILALYDNADLSSFVSSPSVIEFGGFHKEAITLQDDYFVRIMLRYDDDRLLSTPTDIDVDSSLEILEHLFVDGNSIRNKSVTAKHLSDNVRQIISPDEVIYPKFKEIDKPFRTSQDACMVDNEIWYFLGADTEGETAEIRIMDKNTYADLGIKHHDLGHANSVSYSNGNLVTYDPGTQSFYLYEGAKDKSTLLKADPECQELFLTGLDIDGLEGSMCFGENDEIVYYIGYDGQNTDAKMTVYKIKLEKVDGSYTGNTTLLNTFAGDLSGREYARPQGTDYDSFLYVSAGFSHMHTYKISLDYQSETYRVAKDFVINKDVQIESQSTVIDGASAFVSGFTNSGPDYVFKFRI